MRFLIAVLILLAMACLAAAQDAPLTITGGGTKTIQVERTVIVKDNVTLVVTFPFQVAAPAGGNLYAWSVPSTVTAVRKGSILEITAAPMGALTVSVSWIVIDFAAMKTAEKSASVSFIVGSLTPPDPLTKDFAALYAADSALDKAANLTRLAAVMRQGATVANSPAVTTFSQLADAVRAASAATIPADALKALRVKIASEIAAALPSDPDAPLDVPTRKAAVALYTRIATCLEAVK